MELEIKRLNSQDIDNFIELTRIFEDVFEMKNLSIPDNKHLLKLLKRSDFIVFVAITENQIIGGLTAYVLEQYYSKKPLIYIYDLAVKTKYQRQGAGKKLIGEIISYANKRGFKEVFVQADKADDYALDFYRKTPITAEEQVVHFYYTIDKPIKYDQ